MWLVAGVAMKSLGSAKQEIFRELKEKFQAPTKESWRFEDQNLLIPQGSVIEVFGNARFEWLVKFFCEQSDLAVAWVEPEVTLFPPAVAQRGVDVTRWLLLEAGERALWAVEELLFSHFFSVVVAPDLRLTLPVWRRLHLECQRSGTSLLLVSEAPHVQVGSLFTVEAQWGPDVVRTPNALRQSREDWAARDGREDSFRSPLVSRWHRCRQILKEAAV